MRSIFSATRSPDLPNIKIRKHSKSPESTRFITPKSLKKVFEKLENKEKKLKVTTDDSAFRPGSVDFSSPNEKILEKTFTARLNPSEAVPVRKIVEKVPTLRYTNIVMSKDLALMAQMRKGLIGEISSLKVPLLTAENLPAIRNSFCPKEMQNMSDSLQLVQRTKAVSERRARHPFATGAYAIKALRSKAQNQIMEKLKKSLPEGSRFFKYL